MPDILAGLREKLRAEVPSWTQQALHGFELALFNCGSINFKVDFSGSPKITSIVFNLHAMKGGRLYKDFLGKYLKDGSKECTLAFHGTPGENMDSLQRNGMNPILRGTANGQFVGSGDYFSPASEVSLTYNGYSRDFPRQVLVFVLIKSYITYWKGRVIVSQGGHIPIAVLTFEQFAT